MQQPSTTTKLHTADQGHVHTECDGVKYVVCGQYFIGKYFALQVNRAKVINSKT